MEPIIELKKANCKNCYKCIRNCPVKAIACRNDHAEILPEACIYCGRCLLTCPQNAKVVHSDLAKVQTALARGEKLYASVAPSYIAAFPQSGFARMSSALRRLGFVHAEETAIGAAQVVRLYEKLIRAHQMPNIITTACPALNLLVQKYYPTLVPQLAPVVTPSVAHARMLRQIYGSRAKVVFIGPCFSKKAECQESQSSNPLFAVLTFSDLALWMKRSQVEFDAEDPDARTLVDPAPRVYSVPGGLIRNLRREERRVYECISIDGVDRCMEALNSIRSGHLNGYFLEMSACAGGCLGGPVLKAMRREFLASKDILFKNARLPSQAAPALTEGVQAKFSRTFRDRTVKTPEFTEEQIRGVLALTGKTAPGKVLNCGSCGYDTCRDKAIAVLQGKADIHMCVPFMRELAESTSNSVVENIPAGVLILNERLYVQHINRAARKLLRGALDPTGKPVLSVLPSEDFEQVQKTGKNVMNHRLTYPNLGLTVEQTVVDVPDQHLLFVLLRDVTEEETHRDLYRKTSEETAAFAQDVVSRQLRTIQKVVGLLGETATETDDAFRRLTELLAHTPGCSGPDKTGPDEPLDEPNGSRAERSAPNVPAQGNAGPDPFGFSAPGSSPKR